MAILGVGLGAVLAGTMTAGWDPTGLDLPWSLLWIAGAGIELVAIGLLVAAVYPRTSRGRDDDPQLFYFGHAARIDTRQRLRAEIDAAAADPLARVVDQLWAVSRVVTRKYALIRAAIWNASVGAIAVLVSVLGSAADHAQR